MFDFTRFNDLAKRKGITKLYIATQIGRHQSIFNDWSKGKSVPKPEHLRQVATLLDTTPEYLTGESDDPGHAPEPTPAQRQLLSLAETLTNEELQKTLEYVAFLKSQRGK